MKWDSHSSTIATMEPWPAHTLTKHNHDGAVCAPILCVRFKDYFCASTQEIQLAKDKNEDICR